VAKRLDERWKKTPLGTEVDLRTGHIGTDGFPALRERGTAPPPLLGHVCCGYTVAIAVTAELLCHSSCPNSPSKFLLHVLSKIQLICETLFPPRISVTITLQSSLLIYCTSGVTRMSGSSNAPKFNRISLPFLTRFTSGFHQNYLLFKGYRVSYNQKCPTLPVQFRNSNLNP